LWGRGGTFKNFSITSSVVKMERVREKKKIWGERIGCSKSSYPFTILLMSKVVLSRISPPFYPTLLEVSIFYSTILTLIREISLNPTPSF